MHSGVDRFESSKIAKTAVVVFAVWIRSEFYRSFAVSNQNRKINFNFIHNVPSRSNPNAHLNI